MSKLNKRKQEYTEEFDQIQEINILHCDNYFDTEAIFESERFKTMIQTELDKLDSIYSTILTLFYVQELSYTEIIDITGLPLGTIKNRLFRARNLLKESIIKNYHELPV
jgi:RNA polymerase sigma-70 factor (ECF subfamily)